MLLLPLLWLLAASPDDAAQFPLPVDPQRGTAFRFQPSEETALFLFSIKGVPAGTVALRLDRAEGRYTYRSRHLFARASDRTWVTRSGGFTVDRGLKILHETNFPESLWLWRQPKAQGCVTVREELGKRTGPACVTALSQTEVKGTLYGDPFVATYAEGWLASLVLGDSTFRAVPPQTEPEDTDDLFGSGFRVRGKGAVLALRPPRPVETPELTRWNEAQARALSEEIHAELTDKRPHVQDLKAGSAQEDVVAGSCLAHAKRFVAKAESRGHRAALVHGLFVEDGEDRAFPHAWVRVRTGLRSTVDLDPTFAREVTPQTHLPIFAARPNGDDSAAGKVWLDLLAGRRHLLRQHAQPAANQ
ncbi:MAG: transglutaminase domain-containing protein [Myxococcaceae bacterium]